MTKTRTLCVFTRILGFKVFGQFILDELDTMETTIDYSLIEYDDLATKNNRVPRLVRISDDLESVYRMAAIKAESEINAADHDLIIVLGYQLAIPYRSEISTTPTILITDTTPRLSSQRSFGLDGLIRRISKSLFRSVMHHLIITPLFRMTDHFLVMSGAVAESLQVDYGIPASKIDILHPPIADSGESQPTSFLPDKSLPRLLFVGNAFERKGGPFLVDLFSAKYSDVAELVVVSNDPLLANWTPPTGIRHLQNVPYNKMPGIYDECDVFVFPTLKDELGLVLAEAMSRGIPVIARDAGAQSEFVRHGETGLLLDYASSSTEWQRAIDELLFDSAKCEIFRANSLRLANEILNRKLFREVLTAAIQTVGSQS